MRALLKYEIKNRKKILIYGFFLLLILNIIFSFNINNQNLEFENIMRFEDNPNTVGQAILTLGGFSILTAITFMLILFDAVRIYWSDLFADTGYLLFSIPKSSNKILGAKLIVVLIEWFSWLIMVILGGYNFRKVFPWESLKDLFGSREEILQDIIVSLINSSLGFIVFILMIYLSITIAKSFLANSRYKVLFSFIGFFALTFIIGNFKAGISDIVGNLFISSGELLEIVINFLIAMILFITTSYLLENKINL